MADNEVTVALSPALVRLFPGATSEVRLGAATVDAMMDVLDQKWPGMRDRLCDSSPAIRRHLNVFVDGEIATLGTKLVPGAQVYVLTAMSGG
ncbi:MAG: MoaD/ThiS family protein [Hyphomicrobiaceae bacterium]